MTKITFIGAGSTVFTKNIAGDILQRPALANAEIRLMDINPQRLEESEIVVGKLAQTLGVPATVRTFRDQRAALDGTDFVVVAFQIGGYDPCTITDFEVPKKFGLRQTIADTLGIGGIMRGLRTVPHLWKICEDMRAVAPGAIMLQYVNPMAINTWAIAAGHCWRMEIDSPACGSVNPTCAIVLPGGNGPVIVSTSPCTTTFGEDPCITDAPAAPVGSSISNGPPVSIGVRALLTISSR